MEDNASMPEGEVEVDVGGVVATGAKAEGDGPAEAQPLRITIVARIRQRNSFIQAASI